MLKSTNENLEIFLGPQNVEALQTKSRLSFGREWMSQILRNFAEE
jgi:hypothetical protein